MSADEKKKFLKNVVIFVDSREQQNDHIISQLDNLKIKHECKKMDFGDYSFTVQGRDFSLLCAVERKANIEEFYGNIVHDRERIEKEFKAASSIANQFVLLIENCTNEKTMKNYIIPEKDFYNRGGIHRTVQNIGEVCYSTLRSWKCANRYNFDTVFVKDNQNTAKEILEIFFWWWRNYKKLTASRRNKG